MASETRKRLESFLRLLSVATAMHTRMLPTMEVAMRATSSTPTATSSRSMPDIKCASVAELAAMERRFGVKMLSETFSSLDPHSIHALLRTECVKSFIT